MTTRFTEGLFKKEALIRQVTTNWFNISGVKE